MTLSLTPEQAIDEVLDLFKAAWDDTNLKCFYSEIPDDFETSDNSYAQVTVRIGSSRMSGFGDSKKTFERDGTFSCNLYTLSGKGLSESAALVKVVMDSFEGKHTPGGVWFRSINVTDNGRDGAFRITNVSVFFRFHEVK